MHRDARAPCVGLQYDLPLGSSARWTVYRLTHPLHGTLPCWLARLGYIPLRKVDDRVRDRSLRWRIGLFVGSINFVATQLFLIRFDIISFNISFVSFGTTP